MTMREMKRWWVSVWRSDYVKGQGVRGMRQRWELGNIGWVAGVKINLKCHCVFPRRASICVMGRARQNE